MSSIEPPNSTDIYTVLKLEKKNIIGRVTCIDNDEIVFQFILDDKIDLDFVEHIDVYRSSGVYLKDLPVIIVSFKKFYDDQSFTKMLTGEIRVKYDAPELAGLMLDNINPI